MILFRFVGRPAEFFYLNGALMSQPSWLEREWKLPIHVAAFIAPGFVPVVLTDRSPR
jgi:hypothetical protein